MAMGLHFTMNLLHCSRNQDCGDSQKPHQHIMVQSNLLVAIILTNYANKLTTIFPRNLATPQNPAALKTSPHVSANTALESRVDSDIHMRKCIIHDICAYKWTHYCHHIE